MDCNYTWIRNSDGRVYYSKDLIINNTANVSYGVYQCSASCHFRGNDYYIINVREVDVNKNTRYNRGFNDETDCTHFQSEYALCM